MHGLKGVQIFAANLSNLYIIPNVYIFEKQSGKVNEKAGTGHAVAFEVHYLKKNYMELIKRNAIRERIL